MWFNLEIRPLLQDKDYQDFVYSKLFQYTNKIDISLIEYNMLSIDVSQDDLELIARENDFIKSCRSNCDRGMLTYRTILEKIV
jgi:hypothetical protein